MPPKRCGSYLQNPADNPFILLPEPVIVVYSFNFAAERSSNLLSRYSFLLPLLLLVEKRRTDSKERASKSFCIQFVENARADRSDLLYGCALAILTIVYFFREYQWDHRRTSLAFLSVP